MATLAFLQDYGGVLIGLMIMLAAVWFLPGRVRWYVLTAGTAVILYRVWQIRSTKKRFQEWDQRHQGLIQDFNDIKSQRDRLVGEVDGLKQQLEQLKQQQQTLKVKSDALGGEGDQLSRQRHELDQQLADLDQQAAQTDQRIAKIQQGRDLVDKANELLGQAKQVNDTLSDDELMKQAQGL